MRSGSPLWLWRALWAFFLLLGVGIYALYIWLPADGATGDLESFAPEGFYVQWLLEEREGGLQAGDIIVRAGDHTADEWLSGAPRGPEWRDGGIVTYEILRNGQALTLSVPLIPVPFRAILARWTPQLLVSLALLIIGSIVFRQRPHEPAARTLMLFCTTVAVQLWVDAYNIQYAILPRPTLFWFHLFVEHGTFALNYASICHFTLVFPAPHPLMKRFPILAPLAVYISNPLVIALTMLLAPTWSEGLRMGNRASMMVVLVQIGLALAAGLRSVRVARDPVSRAQIRWILWGSCIAMTVAIPGYVLPLALTGEPLFPHPAIMLFTLFIPLVYALAILRYRLFDIEVIINRTLVYGTLTALLVGLYLLFVRLLTLLIQEVLQRHNDTVVTFIATMGIALAFAPLRQRVQVLIDRMFYRSKLDYRRLLPEMSARLATSTALDQIAALLTEQMPQRLQITSATLAVLDPTGERLVPTSKDSLCIALPVSHALVSYLHRRGNPLRRLQPSPRLPAEAQAFLDQSGIELSIPLITGTELVGLYNLGPKLSGNAYNNEELHLLHLLGQQAAIAVENSRLLQAAKRQAEDLAVLYQAAVAVSSSLEMEGVLSTLAEQLGRALDVTSTYISDVDEETGQSTVLAEWFGTEAADTEMESDLHVTYNMRQQYPTSFQALVERQPLVVHASDPNLDPGDRDGAEKYGWKSYLAVPLTILDRLIGYAELRDTRQERHFTEAEIRFCRTLAADAAVAIEHARLFQVEREQRELAEAMEEAAGVVSSTLDLDQVLDRILAQVERVVAGDAFNIMLMEGDNCRAVRSRGYGPLGVAQQIDGLCMPITRYPTLKKMVQSREPIVVRDVTGSSYWTNLEGWEWLQSYVGAPIRIAGRIVGFLNVDGTRADQFSQTDARRLQAFADYAAIAIENARLFSEAQQRAAHLEAHNAVIAAAVGAPNLPELLEIALDHTLQAIGLDKGNIWVADQLVVRDLAAEVSSIITRTAQLTGPSFPIPLAVEDWETMPTEGPLAAIRPTTTRYGIRASLTIPISAEGHHIGGMTLAAARPRLWPPEEIALVEAIGRQLGGAAERLRLLERIRGQAQQVQQIISTVPEGVLLLNADQRILLANPTAQEYLSVLAGAKEGDSLTHLGERPVVELLTAPLEKPWHEVQGQPPLQRTFEVIAQPMETDPEPGGWVLLIRDVTQEREFQAHIQQQNRLAAIGQLAGGIAHDFNNILTSIIMEAQLLLSEHDRPMKIVSGLGAILAESRKATQLVRQILDFSRRSWIELHPLSLDLLIEEVVDILQRTLPENIHIFAEVEPGTYRVQADATRLQQVVVNLALNARDAMPDGGELYIELRRVEVNADDEPPVREMPPGEWACLSVSDGGTGIPPEVMAHLFEPFFTTKPPGQGTGLGLAQVYGIVKRHEGHIAVETEMEQGTTFRVYLPMRPAEGTKEDTPRLTSRGG